MIPIAIISALNTLLGWSITAWVCRRARQLHLIQLPNHRSSHLLPTPNGGGLGIVLPGSLSGASLALFFNWQLGWLVLGLAALLAGVGLFDDIQYLAARVRFAVQVAVCAGVLFALGDLPRFPLSAWLEFALVDRIWFGLLLLAGVWWINLFNFMDGIDGLAATQALFMLLAAALLSVWANPAVVSSPVWLWMLCVAAATLGFLLLNWPPAKIFMGDVGSTWLAFMVFVLALLSVQAGWLSYATWLVLAAVFVTDATATLVTRMLCGECWYQAHRNHAYQKLARRWQGHRPVTLRAIAINLFWLGPLAAACTVWPQWALVWLMLAYAPLVVAAVVLRAGQPEPVGGAAK
jgi:Fuc2NAc and GlcNAc transferase